MPLANIYQPQEIFNDVYDRATGAIKTTGASFTATVNSEFPDAAAITDNFANPTTTNVMAMVMAWDGTTWDRVTNGAGTVATALRTTLGSDDPAVTSLQLLDNAISGAGFNITQFGGAAVPIGAGVEATAVRVTLPTDGTGVVNIAELPTAAAITDNFANPTTTSAMAMLMAYDGTTWDRVPNGAGTVATAVRTTLGSDDPAVTALQVIDDWDETDRAKVNIIAGQAGIAGGTGVDGATVPRVTLATNVALPAGTNAIGKLAANSGVDIGDVDVLSFPNASTATFSAISSSAVTVTLLASNANRKKAFILNNSTSILYFQFSAAAATATATGRLTSQSQFEMPDVPYTGVISGIWDTANGIAQVTEY